MDYLISRQAAIDAICQAACEHRNSECPHPFDPTMDDELFCDGCFDVEAIKRVPSAQQWIPCTERLPEKRRESYWICTDFGYQCECRWTNNVYGICKMDNWGWSLLDIPQYAIVVAWMPLPEPWKEEE